MSGKCLSAPRVTSWDCVLERESSSQFLLTYGGDRSDKRKTGGFPRGVVEVLEALRSNGGLALLLQRVRGPRFQHVGPHLSRDRLRLLEASARLVCTTLSLVEDAQVVEAPGDA